MRHCLLARRSLALLLVAALFALALPAQSQETATPPPAPQGIEVKVLSGAQRVLIPLAVPPMSGDDAAARTVHKTIMRDLELAGFFKLLPASSFFFDPSKEGMEAGEINFDNWTNVNAQGLIKGKLSSSGGKVSGDLRLYEVNKKAQARLKFQASAANAEQLGHDFANAIIEHYTGARGVFGTPIAWVARDRSGLKQIFVGSVGSEGGQQITRNDAINLLPSWGGGRLFYTSYQDRNPDLWVYQGGAHRKLSSQAGQNSGAAQCGSKLALTLSMGGTNTDIYLIDPASGKVGQRLTEHWAIDTSASFSPKCDQLAFVSGRAGSPQLYVMGADGSNARRLTFQGTYNTTPRWSPKGDVIVFTSRDERGAFDIFTVDLQGRITRLTQDQGNNEDPSFSPDGRYIVFSSDRGVKRGQKRLWLMTSDGQYQRPLFESAGQESPAWAH